MNCSLCSAPALVGDLCQRHLMEVAAGTETITTTLMESVSFLGPVFDAADGIRADLARRGWSEHVAEHIAAGWLMQTLSNMFGGSGQ